MAEYIKREAVLRSVQGQRSPCRSPAQNRMLDCLKAAIIRISAADVVPVTRCEDCVRWDDDPDTYGADDGPKGKCMKSFETMCADDFCSYGERKDGGAE